MKERMKERKNERKKERKKERRNASYGSLVLGRSDEQVDVTQAHDRRLAGEVRPWDLQVDLAEEP
jgi:hypothetical protein